MAEEPRLSHEILRASQEIENATAKVKAAAEKKKKASAEDLEKAIEIDAHVVSEEELLEKLGTNKQAGLTAKQVEALLEEYGENKLNPPKEDPEIVKLLKTQLGLFNLLLWFGAILCFISFSIKTDYENLALGCAYWHLWSLLLEYLNIFKKRKVVT